MKTNYFVEERELENAQVMCESFKDTKLAARSAASGLAAIIAKKFFDETDRETEFASSLFNIESIVKDFEISDFYVNGNYIDVRVYFNEKELCIPKSHFDNEMLPLMYMFIKLTPEIDNAEVTGFMLPDSITRIDDVNGYYSINENALLPYEEIEYLLRDFDDNYGVSEEVIYNYTSGYCDNKLGFVKSLIISNDGRTRFKKALTAAKVMEEFDFSFDTTTDSTLPSEESDDFKILLQTEEPSFTNIVAQEEEITGEVTEAPEQNDEYEFSTVTSPKFEFDESDLEETQEGEDDVTDLDTLYNEIETESKDEPAAEENTELIEEPEETVPEFADKIQDTEGIDTLFNENNNESIQEDNISENEFIPPKKKKLPIIPIIFITAIIAAGGYFGYTKFFSADSLPESIPDTIDTEAAKPEQKTSDAMPVETVEKTPQQTATNEGTSVSIPAIEKNLDASILVSNLRIDWEVPAGYASNTSAKRYLIKLGKIIQLNLKSELLLLNRPPISNRISVELKYNNNTKSFETVGFKASSGEKVVDDIIMDTINKALNMKFNTNTDSFGKLSGNPVIIIRL